MHNNFQMLIKVLSKLLINISLNLASDTSDLIVQDSNIF